MSQIQVVPRALLGAIALVCALSLAPAAATAKPDPATRTFDQSCDYPLVAAVPVKTTVTAGLSSGLAGGTVPAAPVTVEVTAPTGAGLNLLGGSTLEGEIVLKVTVDAPGSGSFPLTAKLPFPTTSLAGTGEVSFTGSGELPAFGPLLQSGTATYRLDSISLNATLRKADGTVKRLPPVTEDSDGDPDTFDADCVLDPAGQDPTLYEATVITDPVPPPGFSHQCSLPLVGDQPMWLELTADAPSTVATGESWPQWSFDVAATFGATTSQVIQLANAASIEGTATVGLTLSLAGGFDLPFTVPVVLPNVPIPSGVAEPFTLSGTGTVPQIVVAPAGSFKVDYDDVSFNFMLRNADGSVRPLPGPAVITSGPPNSFDVDCLLDPVGQDTTIAGGQVVISDPFLVKPTVTVSNVGFDSAQLQWSSANAMGQADGYQVVVTGPGGTEKVSEFGPDVRTAQLSSLDPATKYSVVVRATDTESGTQVSSNPVSFTSLPDERVATPPGKPSVSGLTDVSAEVCWEPAVDPREEIVAYEVYLDGRRVTTVTATCATLSGLQQDTSYSVTVRGVAASGIQTASSSAIAFTTKVREEPPPVKYGYGVSGAAQLKNLTRGTVPLAGSVAAELTLATGDFTADLTLQRSTAKLVALGFLPVVAKVDVVPTVPVTGNLAGGVLTAATKVRIKLPQVTLFGLQLAGGSNCQTRSASAINLKSVGEFDAIDGGTLAGTFAISDLTGCGALTGLVSPLTSGPGNTIALKLTGQA